MKEFKLFAIFRFFKKISLSTKQTWKHPQQSPLLMICTWKDKSFSSATHPADTFSPDTGEIHHLPVY